jgi:uncharacterized repeat protein (TIGR03803 family)
MDSTGNLYGTTLAGGSRVKTCAESCGTIFELSAKGVLSTLYSFTASGSAGFSPCCLVMSKSGDLYGMTYHGGHDGCGAVFEYVTTTKKFSTLHEFGNVSTDGCQPIGLLILDAAGDLYGITYGGGTNGEGTIFEVTPKGVESVVYSFTPVTGVTGYPLSNVVQGDKGYFYGLAYNGLYEVTPSGIASILNSGLAVSAGSIGPEGYIARSAAGNFYGGYYYVSGSTRNSGLWEVLGSNDALLEYDFLSGCTICSGPEAPFSPFLFSGDNIYGTSLGGGTSYEGTVFDFDESTGSETNLYSFCQASNCTDGEEPEWNVIADSEGSLYGSTSYGGADGSGTIFKLKKN